MIGTFSFSDDVKTYPFKDGEIQQSSGNITLVFSTGAGSVYTATAKTDGSLSGTSKYANGQVKPFTMVKGAVPVAAAAGPITSHDGKWNGDAYPVNPNCVRGEYEIEIKDGKVSGTSIYYVRSAPPAPAR